MNIKSCILIVLLLIVIVSSTGCFKRSVIPPAGIVRQGMLEDGGVIELSGPWEFYREKLYPGEDFNSAEALKQREYSDYRRYFSRSLFDSIIKQGHCFSTYRLKVDVPHKTDEKLMMRSGQTYRRVSEEKDTMTAPTREAETRKETKRAYLEAPKEAGIFRITNRENGRVYLGSSLNLLPVVLFIVNASEVLLFRDSKTNLKSFWQIHLV